MQDETARIETESEIELERPARGEHGHPLDPLSFVLGMIFAVTGAVFLFGDVDAASAHPAWLAVALFGAVGLILISIGLRRRA